MIKKMTSFLSLHGTPCNALNFTGHDCHLARLTYLLEPNPGVMEHSFHQKYSIVKL